MTPEDDLRRDRNAGDRAKALLNDPILVNAFQRVDEECVRLWRDAKTPEAREGFWMRLQMLQHVKSAIEAVVSDGDLARRKLEQALKGKKPVF